MRRWLILIALVALAPASASAALTLEEALVRAEEVSTDLRLQELSGEAAADAWLADPRAGAPSVRLGVRDLGRTSGGTPDPPEWTARLRFPFPRPWDLSAAARQGRATVAREDAELDRMRKSLRAAVATRFRALPLLRQAAEAAELLTELRVEHVRLIEERRAEGLSTTLDWLDAEEERRDADDDRAAREAEAWAVEAELRTMLGWPADQPLELEPFDAVVVAEAPLPAVEELADVADSSRLAEARAQVERSEARLARQRFQSIPWIDWAQGGAVFQSGRETSFEVGVAIDVPTYHWSRTRTREARHELARSRLRLAAAERSEREAMVERLRSAEAARGRWQVERTHRSAIEVQAGPLREGADPLLAVELKARLVRANLRELLALAEVIVELEKLAAER